MKLLATHITRYLYSGPVSMCHTQVHLTPRMCPGQTVIKCEIHVNPEPDSRSSYQDYFGNDVTSFSVAEPHHELTISSRSLAEMIPRTLPELEHSPPWEQARDLVFDRSISGSLDACQFMFESPLAPVAQQFSDYATSSFPSGRPFLSGVDDLSRRIYSEFSYDPRATTVSTPVDAIFAAHRGVCQDFAHLMIA